MSPLFFAKNFGMDVVQRTTELVNEKIADRPDLFLVDVKMRAGNKLMIQVDGDKGITIEDCAAISRHVGFHLEEEDVVDSAYNLEVSSPGVGEPLLLTRQYIKNIGRNLSVKLADGSMVEGQLLTVNDEDIVLEVAQKPAGKPKSKKTEKVEMTFPLKEITETKILISFK